MKKIIVAATIAATVLGLPGVAPAQAATVLCHGSKPTQILTTSKDGNFAIGTTGNDIIAVVGSAQTAMTQVFGDGGNDLICNLSSNRVLVYGGAGNDTFYGNSTASQFYGGPGADRVFGGDGAEKLFGGAGNDWIEGGAGVDVVSGNEDDDVVYGGLGADVVIGGAGKDVLSGTGNAVGADNAADFLYGPKAELVLTSKEDINYTLPAQLDAYNTTSKSALQSKYKDTSKYMFSKGAQVVTGETFNNCLQVIAQSGSHGIVDFWNVS
jgi:Ca2+-binding RTX toxin-like protein